MRHPTSDRVPEQGPDWFLGAIEACGGGTPNLGFFLEVWGFVGGVGVGLTEGASQGVHEAGGVPSTLVGPTGLPSGSFSFQYFYIFQKNLC